MKKNMSPRTFFALCMNITEDFVDDTVEDGAVFYPCEKCDERFDDNANFKTHFDTNHTHDKSIKWCVSDCDFQAHNAYWS